MYEGTCYEINSENEESSARKALFKAILTKREWSTNSDFLINRKQPVSKYF